MKTSLTTLLVLAGARCGEGFFGPVRPWSRPTSPAVVQRRDSERRSGVRVYQLPPKGFAPSEDEVDYGDLVAAPAGYAPDM